METKFNLNENIKVKLTDKGIEHYFNFYKKYTSQTVDQFKERADQNGYFTFQMWNFMEIFGNKMGINNPELMDLNILLIIPGN